jgi:hypothetical protein
MKKLFILVISFVFIASIGCAEKRAYKFVKQPVPKGATIGIIIDSENGVKNAVMAKFLEKGFKVKAINASDLYTLSDAFTVKDFKKIAYDESEIVLGNTGDAINSVQKSYDSIYKLHIYSYETHKAEMLSEMKIKWGVKFLIVLDLRDWQSVSWARSIDLDTFEVLAIENYPTKYSDNLEGVVDHFIDSLTSM